jgi:hypothetical protein
MRADAWSHRPARRTVETHEPRSGAEGRGSFVPPDQIHIFDVHWLLVGQVPWAFLAELFVRGVVIYVILVAVIRLMGKRVWCPIDRALEE